MAGSGGVTIEDIDLADVGGDGLEARRGRDTLGGEPFAVEVDRGGDATEEGRMVVGGGSVNIALSIEADSPGVVVELMKKFESGPVLGEAVGAHTEASRGYLTSESGIADGSPDLVVETVAEVGWSGMGVIGAPTGEEDLLVIGHIVTIGVLEKVGVWGLVKIDAAISEGEGSGNVELVSEDGDLVAFAIAIGVFKNFQGIITWFVAPDFVDKLNILVGVVKKAERSGARHGMVNLRHDDPIGSPLPST